jgi:DNA-3-methyladenine glycosylase I
VPSGEGLSPGPDGRPRCRWATSTEDYIAYHDAEWGRPVTDDRAMFERICLEAFQSGLSWLTILRKRDGFRAAFHGFDFDALAAFGDGDIDRLLADGSIVRNRAKIEATIANAGATAEMAADGESLAQLVWSFAPARDGAPAAMADIPSTTEESKALAKELKRRGFRFVGPTTAYAAMQACGVVNDHLAGCAFRDEVEAERRQAVGGMRGFSPESSVSGGEAAASDS